MPIPWECPSDGAFAFNKASCAKGILATARASQRFQRQSVRLLPRMSGGMAAWSERPRTDLCPGPLAMVVPNRDSNPVTLQSFASRSRNGLRGDQQSDSTPRHDISSKRTSGPE
jgi:hypothetical protein